MALAARLGRGAVLGSSVWDRQHAFRMVIGPLTLTQYESLLPGGEALRTLVAIVRQHLNGELAWDAQLVLVADEVPTAQIGRYGRLGCARGSASNEITPTGPTSPSMPKRVPYETSIAMRR